MCGAHARLSLPALCIEQSVYGIDLEYSLCDPIGIDHGGDERNHPLLSSGIPNDENLSRTSLEDADDLSEFTSPHKDAASYQIIVIKRTTFKQPAAALRILGADIDVLPLQENRPVPVIEPFDSQDALPSLLNMKLGNPMFSVRGTLFYVHP